MSTFPTTYILTNKVLFCIFMVSQVISRQEAEHELRMELSQTQLQNAKEENKLTMEILHLKKRKLENGKK